MSATPSVVPTGTSASYATADRHLAISGAVGGAGSFFSAHHQAAPRLGPEAREGESSASSSH
jgi:hypothetical protein